MLASLSNTCPQRQGPALYFVWVCTAQAVLTSCEHFILLEPLLFKSRAHTLMLTVHSFFFFKLTAPSEKTIFHPWPVKASRVQGYVTPALPEQYILRRKLCTCVMTDSRSNTKEPVLTAGKCLSSKLKMFRWSNLYRSLCNVNDFRTRWRQPYSCLPSLYHYSCVH